MKTLELNQMEGVCGGDHCSAATFWSIMSMAAPMAAPLFAPFGLYETIACAVNPGGDTF